MRNKHEILLSGVAQDPNTVTRAADYAKTEATETASARRARAGRAEISGSTRKSVRRRRQDTQKQSSRECERASETERESETREQMPLAYSRHLDWVVDLRVELEATGSTPRQRTRAPPPSPVAHLDYHFHLPRAISAQRARLCRGPPNWITPLPQRTQLELLEEQSRQSSCPAAYAPSQSARHGTRLQWTTVLVHTNWYDKRPMQKPHALERQRTDAEMSVFIIIFVEKAHGKYVEFSLLNCFN